MFLSARCLHRHPKRASLATSAIRSKRSGGLRLVLRTAGFDTDVETVAPPFRIGTPRRQHPALIRVHKTQQMESIKVLRVLLEYLVVECGRFFELPRFLQRNSTL